MRLYCLPHAGGSANAYLAWKRHLESSIALEPVELSGRGRRITAPLFDRFGDVLTDVVEQVTQAPVPDDYAILGHSFGAILAFELAHELTDRGHPPPHRLFISASCAPSRVGEIAIPIADGNRELLSSLAHLGGTPHEILADSEAVELFAPILRADLHALFDYRESRSAKLTCDMSIVLAADDSVADQTDAGLWAELTAGEAETYVIDGGHFAALERPAAVAVHVNEVLQPDPKAGSTR